MYLGTIKSLFFYYTKCIIDKMSRIPENCQPQNNMDCYYNRHWMRLEAGTGANNFSTVQDKIDTELFNYLIAINRDSDDPVTKNMAIFRDSYFDRKTGSPVLRDLVKTISVIDNEKQLAMCVELLTSLRIGTIFNVGVSPNFQDPDVYTLAIGDMSLSVETPESFYDTSEDPSTIDKFFLLARDLYRLLDHWGYDRTNQDSFISNVLQFEMLFAKSVLSLEEQNNPHVICNSLRWNDFLNEFESRGFWSQVLGKIASSSTVITFENHRLLSFTKDYIDQIYDIQNGFDMFVDYLAFCVAKKFAIFSRYAKSLEYVSPFKVDTRNTFIDMFYIMFGYQLQKIFDQNNLEQRKVNAIQDMFNRMKKYCVDVYTKSQVFSKKTTDAALMKLNKLDIIIGSQKYDVDMSDLPELVDDFYHNY